MGDFASAEAYHRQGFYIGTRVAIDRGYIVGRIVSAGRVANGVETANGILSVSAGQ